MDAEKVKKQKQKQREWQRKEKKRARAVELMAWERERERERSKAGGKEAGTPDGKERVTIKLRVTPKGVEKKVRFELEEDKKGKGKAAEEGDADTDAEAKPKDDGSEEAGAWDGAGWDSELSDITDSSDGESEIEVGSAVLVPHGWSKLIFLAEGGPPAVAQDSHPSALAR
jgi:hypothetical protein